MQYRIEGGSLPIVIINLENGESVVCEAGAMAWMSDGIEMSTTSGGGVGKVFGRMFSGESLFMNVYTSHVSDGEIAFASSFPGSILPIEITAGHEIIAQKRAFLASTQGVDLSVAFQKNFGAGLFGGEGFIMQKIAGNGTAFLEIDGCLKEYQLGVNEKMMINTGYLAAMETSCKMEVVTVGNVKNALLGGEGIFNTVVTGPGKVWVQSMPVATLAHLISGYIPVKTK